MQTENKDIKNIEKFLSEAKKISIYDVAIFFGNDKTKNINKLNNFFVKTLPKDLLSLNREDYTTNINHSVNKNSKSVYEVEINIYNNSISSEYIRELINKNFNVTNIDIGIKIS